MVADCHSLGYVLGTCPATPPAESLFYLDSFFLPEASAAAFSVCSTKRSLATCIVELLRDMAQVYTVHATCFLSSIHTLSSTPYTGVTGMCYHRAGR